MNANCSLRKEIISILKFTKINDHFMSQVSKEKNEIEKRTDYEVIFKLFLITFIVFITGSAHAQICDCTD